MVYVQMEYYSATKQNEIMPLLARWMDLEIIILTEVRQRKRNINHLRYAGNGTRLQYSCLENPMDGGASCAAVHGVAKSWTRLSDFTFTFHFHALEKETATHSSALAWRIPGTGEPGGLPSMGVAQSRTRLKRLSSSSSSSSRLVIAFLQEASVF